MKRNFSALITSILILTLLLNLISSCAGQKPINESKTVAEEPKVVEQQQQESAKTEEKTTQVEQKEEISPEVKELLDKQKTKVKSIYYKYRGPETGSNFYEFYIKDTKIKYKPYLETKSLDAIDSYDSIFTDKVAKTAQSYCEAAYCAYKGKKANLDYDSYYILTVFDWISSITEAQKVGEEVIEDRTTWKIQANNGLLWIDTFYGIPLKVESNGKTYRFQQISVNNVKDEDVVPSS